MMWARTARAASSLRPFVAPHAGPRTQQAKFVGAGLSNAGWQGYTWNLRREKDYAATGPGDPGHLVERGPQPRPHVALHRVPLPEREVRDASVDTGVRKFDVAYVPGLDVRRRDVVPGRLDGGPVDVGAASGPPGGHRLGENRPRPAAGVEQDTRARAGLPDHRRRHGRTERTRPLGCPAAVLAHVSIGDAQPGDDLARPVLDGPHLQAGGILDTPARPSGLNGPRQLPPQISPEERALLKDPRDHPVGHARPEPTRRRRPDRQGALDPLDAPDAVRDPARIVAVGPRCPADLDEDILGQDKTRDAV